MVFSTAELNDTILRLGFGPHMLSILYRFCGFTTAQFAGDFSAEKCNFCPSQAEEWIAIVLGFFLLELHESVTHTDDMRLSALVYLNHVMVVIVAIVVVVQ